jgi:hypothetical protein
MGGIGHERLVEESGCTAFLHSCVRSLPSSNTKHYTHVRGGSEGTGGDGATYQLCASEYWHTTSTGRWIRSAEVYAS